MLELVGIRRLILVVGSIRSGLITLFCRRRRLIVFITGQIVLGRNNLAVFGVALRQVIDFGEQIRGSMFVGRLHRRFRKRRMLLVLIVIRRLFFGIRVGSRRLLVVELFFGDLRFLRFSRCRFLHVFFLAPIVLEVVVGIAAFLEFVGNPDLGSRNPIAAVIVIRHLVSIVRKFCRLRADGGSRHRRLPALTPR